MDFSDDIVKEYAIESVARLQSVMDKLDGNMPTDTIINDCMRGYHSIKSGAGFLSIPGVVSLCHRLESVLDKVKHRQLIYSDDLYHLVSASNAALAAMFAAIHAGHFPKPCDPALLSQLDNVIGEMTEIDSMNNQSDIDTLMETIQTSPDSSLPAKSAQTLDALFQKLPGLAEELGVRLGKQVDLTIRGGDLIVNKTILDSLFDPLVHLIRNAIDHGIESSDIRVQSGKSSKGHLQLSAKVQSGRLQIDFSDDGAGLQRERIIEVALKANLMNEDQIKKSREADIFDLIFEPGFSTRQSVTELSGRGFGLDAVKEDIQKLEGTIQVHSRAKKGTEFIITIPIHCDKRGDSPC